MISTITLFFRDESGQDLIEHALLAAFVGLAGAAVFLLLTASMGNAYRSWDAGAQNLWEPAAPR